MEYDLTRTSHVLMKAADLIEVNGWVRGGEGWRGEGGYCIEGAIAAASGVVTVFPHDHVRICPAYASVVDFLDRDGAVVPRLGYTRDHEPALWLWNDRDARNAAEVVEVLRGAAIVELCKEKHAELDLRDAVDEALAPVFAEVREVELVAA